MAPIIDNNNIIDEIINHMLWLVYNMLPKDDI